MLTYINFDSIGFFMPNISYFKDELEEFVYLNGQCHLLAIAFLEINSNWNLEVVQDCSQFYDGDGVWDCVMHVYAVDDKGVAWDIRGGRPVEEVIDDVEECFGKGKYYQNTFTVSDFLSEFVSTENKDAPLIELNDYSMKEASDIAKSILVHCHPDFILPSLSSPLISTNAHSVKVSPHVN